MLANIACGTSSHKKLVIRHGAVEKFVELLNSTENVVNDLKELVYSYIGCFLLFYSMYSCFCFGICEEFNVAYLSVCVGCVCARECRC